MTGAILTSAAWEAIGGTLSFLTFSINPLIAVGITLATFYLGVIKEL